MSVGHFSFDVFRSRMAPFDAPFKNFGKLKIPKDAEKPHLRQTRLRASLADYEYLLAPKKFPICCGIVECPLGARIAMPFFRRRVFAFEKAKIRFVVPRRAVFFAFPLLHTQKFSLMRLRLRRWMCLRLLLCLRLCLSASTRTPVFAFGVRIHGCARVIAPAQSGGGENFLSFGRMARFQIRFAGARPPRGIYYI